MFKLLIYVSLFYCGVCIGAVRNFEPVANSTNQSIEMDNGKAILYHNGQRVSLGAEFIAESSKLGWLSVSIQNTSNQSINISEHSFTVTSLNMPLKVYTYNELLKKEKNTQMWIAIANGVAAGANSYSASMAGNTTYSGSYRSTTNATAYSNGSTAYGNATTQGIYSGSSYNAGAAYVAQSNALMQNQAIFDRSSHLAALRSQSLEGRALKANTISPNEVVSGQVKFDLPKKEKNISTEFSFTIQTDSDPIILTFREVF